ncbi:hypothetical protein D3C84_839510 [compost metagenome]
MRGFIFNLLWSHLLKNFVLLIIFQHAKWVATQSKWIEMEFEISSKMNTGGCRLEPIVIGIFEICKPNVDL